MRMIITGRMLIIIVVSEINDCDRTKLEVLVIALYCITGQIVQRDASCSVIVTAAVKSTATARSHC